MNNTEKDKLWTSRLYPTRPADELKQKKHCVVYVVPQLQFYEKDIKSYMQARFLAWNTFAYTFCWALARKMSSSHAINAYAITDCKEPNQDLVRFLTPIIEEVIADQRFAATIFDATQTLDIDAGLILTGYRLTIKITTFPTSAFITQGRVHD